MHRPLAAAVTGASLGLIGGVVDCLLAVRAGDALAQAGILPGLVVLAWGAAGLVAGIVAGAGGAQGTDERHAGAVVVARVLVALGLFLLVARVAGTAGAARLVAATAAGLVFGAALWAVAGRIVWPGPIVATAGLPFRLRWALLIASALAATLLLTAGDRRVELRRYAPAAVATVAEQPAAPRVLFLGIDGASWNFVMPLVRRGLLPNLRALMERGTSGVLRSLTPSYSPEVWTSIVTGRGLADHGVHNLASDRKVKAIWQIAEENGLRTAVVNVPGTYPLLGDSDLMLAGFPLPGRANFSNLGWIATTGRPVGHDRGPITVRLDLGPGASADTLELADLAASLPLRGTSPSLLLYRLAGFDRALGLQRAAAPVSFGRIELELAGGPAAGDETLIGRAGDELFRLRRSEWSDWLVARIEGREFGFKAHFVDDSPDEITLYVTPLFLLADETVASSVERIGRVLTSPYVVEGAGWLNILEPRLLESLRDHLLDVAASHQQAGLAILDHYPVDLFFYVYTVTDRMQHGMLKFAFPDVYRELADSEGGDYERFRPTPEQVERVGDAVKQTYLRVDGWIGEMLERAGPETVVVIASDHGSRAGMHAARPTGGIHHPDGIYIVAPAQGPVRESGLMGGRGPTLSLVDMAPTVLHLLGLPVALDMAGRLPPFLIDDGETIAAIESYEREGGVDVKASGELDPAMLEQLKSLGYVQ